MGLLISLLSSSLQQCWDLGSQISLLCLHLYDGVVVVGFVVVSGFWLGSVVNRGGGTLGFEGAMAPPKFFKTSIIVGINRSHTFSFKSWPPMRKTWPLLQYVAIKMPHPKFLPFLFFTFPFF